MADFGLRLIKMPSMASAHRRQKDDREIDLEVTSDGSDDEGEDSMDVNSDR